MPTNGQTIGLHIDADPATRAGGYADVAIISTKGTIARLDFVQTDGEMMRDENGNAMQNGVLTARVFLSSNAIIDLRDALTRHIDQHILGISQGQSQ